MQYNLSFELTAFAFLSFICVKYFGSRKFPDKKNTHFGIFITLAWASIAFKLICCYAIKHAQQIPPWMNNAIFELQFMLQYLTLFFLTNYVLMICGLWNKSSMSFILVHLILAVVLILMIAANSFTNWLFYFDEDLVYHKGYSYGLYTVLLCLSLALDSLLCIWNHKRLGQLQFLMVPTLSAMVLASLAIQRFYPDMLLTGFAFTMGTMLLFLDIQNPGNEQDFLTKAYSRERLSRFTQDLISAKRSMPLLYVDIYGMSMFNKSFGEENGNILLMKVASLLESLCPKALLFRYSGDSFLLLVPDVRSLDTAKVKLYDALERDFNLGFASIRLQLKLFTFTAMDKESSSESLARTLELAIKAMKDRPVNVIEHVSDFMVAKSHKSREIERALRSALDSDAIEAYFQPVIDTSTGKVVAAEALARIEDSMMGIIQPNEFIPVAEETGLIGKLGLQMARNVCIFLAKSKLDLKWISLNLSVADCMNPSYGKNLLFILRSYKIDPSRIVLEITETMAMLEEALPDNLRNLSQLGFRLAIDDFGTEYANMDSVLRLPFSLVKLDRSVVNLGTSLDRELIMSKMVGAFEDLGLDAVAEGIESADMVAMAKATGVRYMQGFYFASPLEPSRFLHYLDSRRPADEV